MKSYIHFRFFRVLDLLYSTVYVGHVSFSYRLLCSDLCEIRFCLFQQALLSRGCTFSDAPVNSAKHRSLTIIRERSTGFRRGQNCARASVCVCVRVCACVRAACVGGGVYVCVHAHVFFFYYTNTHMHTKIYSEKAIGAFNLSSLPFTVSLTNRKLSIAIPLRIVSAIYTSRTIY